MLAIRPKLRAISAGLDHWSPSSRASRQSQGSSARPKKATGVPQYTRLPSLGAPAMAANKRNPRQEDKNLARLREIGARPENKTCFDCGQKGPTYVNTTIGSFVCTHCSGLLRGLTPPHRVKSISMASFTADELENLSKHGNDYCRRIWLGTYEDKLGPPDFKDEHKVRDFMIAKYERKKYYVDPAQVDHSTPAVERSPPAAKPLSSLVSNVSPLTVRATNSVPSHSSSSVSPADSAWKRSMGNLPKPETETGGGRQKFDPFGSLPTSPTHSKPVVSQPNFADFDNNPVFLSIGPLKPPPGFTPPSLPSSLLASKNPFLADLLELPEAELYSLNLDDLIAVSNVECSSKSTPFTSAMSSVSPPAASKSSSTTQLANFGSPPVPTLLSATASSSSTSNLQVATDKYAALADLDELFKSTTVSGSPSSNSGPVVGSAPGGDWAGGQAQPAAAANPWMKPSGFHGQNGAVPNPFQNPTTPAGSATTATAIAPAQAKSTNPFAQNGGGETTDSSFVWGQPPAQLPPTNPTPSQSNWANFNSAPIAPVDSANPWGSTGSVQPTASVTGMTPSASPFGAGFGSGNSQGFNPWNSASVGGGFSTGAGFMGSTPNPFAMENALGAGITAAPQTAKSNPFL